MVSLAGIPLVYAHSLTAARNDGARQRTTGVARDLNRGRYPSADDYLAAVDGPVGRALLELLSWRAQSDAFHPDAAQIVHDSPGATAMIERRAEHDRRLVIVNLGASPTEVDLGPGWIDPHDRPVPSRQMLAPAGVVRARFRH